MKKLILGFAALLAIAAFSTTTLTAADGASSDDAAPAKCGSSKPKPVAPDVMCGRSK